MQSRSFWPVAMGGYEDWASFQVRGVSGNGPASKVRSPGQSRGFWPDGVGGFEDRASLQVQLMSRECLRPCLQGDVSKAIAVFLAGRSRGMRVSGISSGRDPRLGRCKEALPTHFTRILG